MLNFLKEISSENCFPYSFLDTTKLAQVCLRSVIMTVDSFGHLYFCPIYSCMVMHLHARTIVKVLPCWCVPGQHLIFESQLPKSIYFLSCVIMDRHIVKRMM